ncbi:hypothetical protein GUJ93_ZPchr0014g46727 [Zizania palustris]|uniref:Uncharacterized protein n=1 Tax=Zizania palustris TaxID=103762 RepID=A0A8J5SWQ1_ZIZPA|nr:hypothetical protein GUJ93_ZPchr0014g46727 [Zizania palustris]
MQGKNVHVVLYLIATFVLTAIVSLVFMLTLRWWPPSAASEVATDVTYILTLGVVEVFSIATVTTHYFECREMKQVKDMAASHHYTNLPNDDEANI